MKIVGLLKTTLLDYPGHVAATIFLGGCNFRCPFCHNMDLVELKKSESGDKNIKNIISYTKEDILKFIDKRAGILDGVCITGGEPTLYDDLFDFIVSIKEKGILVKLDTNGTNPEKLKKLLDNRLLDYVAMDIKSSIDEYENVAGIKDTDNKEELINKVKESIELLKESNIEYEFRTTVVDEYHNKSTMMKIGELINGAKKYFLQVFTDSEYVLDHSLTAPTKEDLLVYKDILSKYVENVEVRGL